MVERALLVRICFDKREEEESRSLLNELAELVTTLGIGVVSDQLVRARAVSYTHLTLPTSDLV